MSPARQAQFWLVGTGLFLFLIYVMSSVLLPFVAGAAVAYFLDPVADWLERRRLSRLAATVVITLGFVVVLVVLLVFLVPVLQAQVVRFVEGLPDYVEALQTRLEPLFRDVLARLPAAEVARWQESAGEHLGSAVNWLGKVLGRVLSGGVALLNLVSLLVITPVVAFYLLRDWDRMVAVIDDWLPRAHAETIRAQFRAIDTTLAGFVRGQATVCLALGVFYAVGLSLAGLELGLVVGLGAGLISFVPYLGSLLGGAVSLGLAIAQWGEIVPVAIVAAIFATGQAVEGNFLTPKLVGDKVGLHPVWVMFALLAGGSLFGFVGVLLAVPVAAVIGVLARFSLNQYMASPLYLGGRRAEPQPDADPPTDPSAGPS
ncbi:AI-2E family transporter [Roseospirillum parvum]|uniref:Predicted PurR-regulated permease PerM n=1 Tax=Roseospirillum parvum TaxID=83401 RepID=A0A1G7VXL3_9PROT|nr:AI-2E family transporter [Roseospirillum parvum]SDG64381.1 Predicted PurR-regulated permease PerM [Roseospirillum parvum]